MYLTTADSLAEDFYCSSLDKGLDVKVSGLVLSGGL